MNKYLQCLRNCHWLLPRPFPKSKPKIHSYSVGRKGADRWDWLGYNRQSKSTERFHPLLTELYKFLLHWTFDLRKLVLSYLQLQPKPILQKGSSNHLDSPARHLWVISFRRTVGVCLGVRKCVSRGNPRGHFRFCRDFCCWGGTQDRSIACFPKTDPLVRCSLTFWL